jgi:hypothetical protein
MTKPIAKESLTVTNAVAVAFASVPAGASRAKISNDPESGSAIRFWIDGSVPTSTEGHYISAGDWFELENRDEIINFLAISLTATSAKLKITYIGI